LRERTEDVRALAEAFFARFAAENGVVPKPVDANVFDALAQRAWPGNVRELRNVVERMAILAAERVTIADLPEDPHRNPFEEEESGDGEKDAAEPWEGSKAREEDGQLRTADLSTFVTLREHRERAERDYLLETLRAANWNISKSAVVLGVERTNLHKKIRTHGIKRGE
jgi:DNA-binding NtrC family response regulator